MSKNTLSDQSITLEPANAGHINDDYLSWLNDKELMRFSRQRHFTHTRDSSLAYQETFKGTNNHYWAILEKDSGQMIGTINAYVDKAAGTADVGIMIGHPQARGKGYGKKAWALVLKFLFEEENMRKVTCGTVRGNAAMEGIAAHFKMQLEGVLRQQEILDDGPADVLKYGLLKAEYLR